MGPKKDRRVRKIEVSTDTPAEFELGHTTADVERRRKDREARETEEIEKQREEARREKTTHSAEEGACEDRYK